VLRSRAPAPVHVLLPRGCVTKWLEAMDAARTQAVVQQVRCVARSRTCQVAIMYGSCVLANPCEFPQTQLERRFTT